MASIERELWRREMMRRLSFLALLILAVACLPALEVKDGLIKIVLQEDSGRFSVYYLDDVAKGRYEPLIFDRDPRTSSLNVYVDQKLYRMGESTEFRIGARRNGAGADFVFKSAFCTVTENFSFVKSKGSSLADGVKISVSVENITERDIFVGCRVIVDSYLGETLAGHFGTNIRQKISNETLIDSRSKDEWLTSVPVGAAKVGLLIPLAASGMTQADQVYLANWSRLNSAAWDFDFNQTRNFTLQPYSINDSAIALDWNPALIQAGKSRLFSYIAAGFKGDETFTFGAPSANGVAGFTAVAASASSTSTSTKPATGGDLAVKTPGDAKKELYAQAQTDYLVIGDLISRINSILASGNEPSDADVANMKEALDGIKAKRSQY
jgi:hypothetical protein